jgi:predicted alpha/beta-hydrolase family hydrolase
MPKRTRAQVAAAKQEEGQEYQNEEESQPDKDNSEDEDQDGDENLTTFQLPFKKDKQIRCETRECPSPSSFATLVFTHGAGGGLESAAMRSFAAGFSRCGRITSFQGNMNLTSRVGMFRTAASHHQEAQKGSALILGGRSMGARAAVLTALELISEGVEVQALVLVSYPLTASKNGKQEREFERREKILLDLPEDVDVLFVGGTRDVQCDLEALAEIRQEMKGNSWIVQVNGADHGMSLSPKAGTQEVGELMGEVAARWVGNRDHERRVCEVVWDGEEGKAHQGEWREESIAVGEKAQHVNEKKRKIG